MRDNQSEIILKVHEGPDVAFVGRKLASVSSAERSGYRAELAIYRTESGMHVCAKRMVSCPDNVHHEQIVSICDSAERIGEFFGYDRYAKMLYAIVDIDMAVHVD
ncbi:MAG: hypothetical protein ACR2PI_18560 [Hyphomicrobiaceae bacterium]